jgi:hypothetical protein
MSQAWTRTVRKKAESLSLSAKFFALALHVRLRTQHPPTADKQFPRSSSRCLLKYNEQRIQSLVQLAGYRQLISSLVIFDRSLRVRSENSVDLTGIDSESSFPPVPRPQTRCARCGAEC